MVAAPADHADSCGAGLSGGDGVCHWVNAEIDSWQFPAFIYTNHIDMPKIT
jgi:hypothetical protein